MDLKKNLLAFVQRAVQTKSFSDEEGELAHLVLEEMQRLDYDEAFIDGTGNVVGKIGDGPRIVHFDSHMDTVRVNDPEHWRVPPFSGEIADGYLWGRGSVDMKSALGASVYAAAIAKRSGYLAGKTVYVTGSVCEEYCDGENLKHLYRDLSLKPDFCVICEPSDNVITLGHKGKAQIRIRTKGVSAHGSAPEKGVNAVYEMAEIISRVDALNRSLYRENEPHGTVVLSDISCVSASLNAVPSECAIYLDRRLALGETLGLVERGIDRWEECNVGGRDAAPHVVGRKRADVRAHARSLEDRGGPPADAGPGPGIQERLSVRTGGVRFLGFRDQRDHTDSHGHSDHRFWARGVQAGAHDR